MTRTQIQIPDALYRQAKALAEAREISMAELVRMGLEYILRVSAPPVEKHQAWTLPEPVHLGKSDPFDDPAWRMSPHFGKVPRAIPTFGTDQRRRRHTDDRNLPLLVQCV